MKNTSKIKTLVSMIILTSILNAEESEVSYGLGMGVLYNGVGVNISSQTKEDLKYLSVGCIDFSYNSYTGLNTNCGLGIGYINTSLIGDSNQHGVGAHLAAHEDGGDNKVQVSLGAGYTYFIDLSKIGWNFGLTPIYIFGDSENNDKLALMFDVGYQF